MTVWAYKEPPPEVVGPLTQLVNWAAWLVIAICVVAVIICAGTLMWHRRMGHASMEAPTGKLFAILAAAAVIGSATSIATAILAP